MSATSPPQIVIWRRRAYHAIGDRDMRACRLIGVLAGLGYSRLLVVALNRHLSLETGMIERAVTDGLARLAELGLIAIEGKGKGRRIILKLAEAASNLDGDARGSNSANLDGDEHSTSRVTVDHERGKPPKPPKQLRLRQFELAQQKGDPNWTPGKRPAWLDDEADVAPPIDLGHTEPGPSIPVARAKIASPVPPTSKGVTRRAG